MFVVRYLLSQGTTHFYLRNTIFTAELDRATQFATVPEAKAAIEKARKFHMARVIRACRIVKLSEAGN